MFWKFEKGKKRSLKSGKNSCKISLKVFIFNRVVGLHLANLLKNFSINYFIRILSRFWEDLNKILIFKKIVKWFYKLDSCQGPWTWLDPARYLNVFHYNRTQRQLQYLFLKILQKYYYLPILGTLDMPGIFHLKR